MKIIHFLILLIFVCFSQTQAQDYPPFPYDDGVVEEGEGTVVYASDYDGSTEYCLNTSPTNMDLNGANIIFDMEDNSFEIVTMYVSDFSAGTDGWELWAGVTISGNLDVHDSNDVFGVISTSTGSSRPKKNCWSNFLIGTRYFSISDCYMPSTNTSISAGSYTGNVWTLLAYSTTFDSWNTMSGTGVHQTQDISWLQLAFTGAVAGDTIYHKNINVTSYPNWTATGNHSFSVTDVSPLVGSYSGKIISTGVGDVDNCFSLSTGDFTDFVDGTNYTFEMRTQSKGIYGDIINDTDKGGYEVHGTEDWSAYGTNVIETTDDSHSGDSALKITFVDHIYGAVLYFRETSFINKNLTIGQSYYLECWVKVEAGNSITLRAVSSDPEGALHPSAIITSTDWIKHSGIIYCGNETAGSISLTGFGTGEVMYIDDIFIQEINTPDITLSIGDSSWTWTDVSADDRPSTEGEVLVKNFTAGADFVGADIKFYSSQADTILIDEIDLSEAYNMTWLAWFKTSSTETMAFIDQRNVTGIGFGPGMVTVLAGSEFLIRVGDAHQTPVFLSTAYSVDTWHLMTFTVDRMGSAKIWMDGVEKVSGSMTKHGRISNSVAFKIGNALTLYFDGLLGETQIVREYCLIEAEILTCKNNGIAGLDFPSSYLDGTVISWFKWAGDDNAVFLQDEQGNNNLTGVNMTQADDQVVLENYGN